MPFPVAIVARSRKSYLAKLFSSLLRVSARKKAVLDGVPEGGLMADPSAVGTLFDYDQWQILGMPSHLQAQDDSEARSLFETSFDEFGYQ